MGTGHPGYNNASGPLDQDAFNCSGTGCITLHALGLAVPLVAAISKMLGATNGLLIRDRRGLEEARNLDTVIFNKTGTLTLGEFRVVDMSTTEGVSEDEALRIAFGVESESEHPI